MPLRGAVPILHRTRANSERVQLGRATIWLLEDGTHTDTRVGCLLMALPAGAAGPPMHWHRFHDECFLVTRGVVTFVTLASNSDGDGGGGGGSGDGEVEIEVAAGEMVAVPPRAPHTFRNKSADVDAEVFMTATPGFYIDYFRAMGKIASTGQQLTPEITKHVMELFGTFPPDVASEP
ncbi:RmlC-like cupin domain-containing protein [Xylariaceae sp. FL0662B]|nr:RmlC-like cupin domain-containing protein [Xylariaceae sp. FL0662B]